MATGIIILNTPIINGDRNIDFVFWLYPAVANRQFYTSSSVSAFQRATTLDNTELQTGVKVEERHTFLVPTGWTVPQIKAELTSRYTARATQFANEQAKWNNSGIAWDKDSATWGNL